MGDTGMIILSLSICLPLFFVLINIRKVQKQYLPFFVLIIISFLVEIASIVLYNKKITNAHLLNVFGLVEFFCWLLFFQQIDGHNKKKYCIQVKVLGAVGLLLWVADNFFISKIDEFNLVFKVYYSFVLILLALDEINALIVYRKKRLRKNPIFIICAGLIIFFCYKIFIEVLWNFGTQFSRELLINFFTVQSIVNAFVNLLFTLAIIWAPKKKYFIKPS